MITTGLVEHKDDKKQTAWVHYKRRHHEAIVAAIILTPMLLWWFVASGFPTFFGFLLGFFDWKQITATPKFTWFSNFVEFFNNGIYLSALWRTIWLGGLVTFLTIVLGFGIALLMNLPLRGKGLYRSMWYAPSVTSAVAITQVMYILLNPIDGVVNKLFEQLGFQQIVWSDSVIGSIVLIVLYSVWRGVGGAALIWLAGLQSIDPVMYEAANVDGAGRLAKFLHITIPGLKPMATYIVITGVISGMQIYEPVAFISNGGPYEKTEVLALRIIKDGFFNFNFGIAGASGMVLAVIVFAISVSYYKFSKNEN